MLVSDRFQQVPVGTCRFQQVPAGTSRYQQDGPELAEKVDNVSLCHCWAEAAPPISQLEVQHGRCLQWRADRKQTEPRVYQVPVPQLLRPLPRPSVLL